MILAGGNCGTATQPAAGGQRAAVVPATFTTTQRFVVAPVNAGHTALSAVSSANVTSMADEVTKVHRPWATSPCRPYHAASIDHISVCRSTSGMPAPTDKLVVAITGKHTLWSRRKCGLVHRAPEAREHGRQSRDEGLDVTADTDFGAFCARECMASLSCFALRAAASVGGSIDPFVCTPNACHKLPLLRLLGGAGLG
jgi:hypothetical protein